ncbi:FAD-dependent oxidoreductase [Mycoplasmatota bacterium WC44]
MKVIVIGCTHTGTAAIKEILNSHKNVEITVYEINDNISFLSCGIALCVGKTVGDINSLFYSSPEELESAGVNVFVKHKVVDVNIKDKTIKAINLDTNEEISDNYDKLVISTGSWPIEPNIEGVKLENILLSKNFKHANKIIEASEKAHSVAIVGAGYIGVELAESFKELGKEVVLIDALDTVIGNYVDKEFASLVEEELKHHNVRLAMGEKVVKFEGDSKVKAVITSKNRYEVDLVIMCVGFRPNNGLVVNQLDTLPNGAIVVNEYMQTSDPDVFAGGDSVTLDYLPDRSKSYIPLATNALRTGTLIGKNLLENKVKHPGTNATSSIKIFTLNISTTGLTEKVAKTRGLVVDSVTVSDNHLLEFMANYEKTTLKVVFEKESKRVIGAQFITRANLPQTINVMSMVIHSNLTIDELPYLDFYFLPHFNKPWNIINLAGLKATETN